ncbi:MAG: arginine N-succinyltransferase [Actinomycetota bacterium]
MTPSAPDRQLDDPAAARTTAFLRPITDIDGAAVWDLLQRGQADVTGMSSLPTSAAEAEERCAEVAATVATLEAGRTATNGPDTSAPLLLALEEPDGTLLGLTGCTIKDGIVNHSVEIGTSTGGRGLSVTGRERAWTATELNATYLAAEARGRGLGSLLSRGRLAFLVPVVDQVPALLVSHLRGPMGTGPSAPFWSRFGREVLPEWPTSVRAEAGLVEEPERLGELTGHTLAVDPSLLDVVGSVHRLSLPAYRILQAEGFVSNGMYDPVDAGPTVTCDLDATTTWRRHRLLTVAAAPDAVDPLDAIVTNGAVAAFRACRTTIGLPADGVSVALTTDARRALTVAAGDRAVVVAGEPQAGESGTRPGRSHP